VSADDRQRQAGHEESRRQDTGRLAEGVGLGAARHQAAEAASAASAQPAEAAFLLLQKDRAHEANGDQDVNDQNDLHRTFQAAEDGAGFIRFSMASPVGILA
jgi:hypothetical protein